MSELNNIQLDGASLTFAYLQAERQRHRYASADFQYVGFDEVTTFTEAMFRFLFSRLRREEGHKVPLRMRSASNPGNIGHQWVYRRYINPGTPGAVFVPSKVQDNPSLDIREYLKSLDQLDPITRSRLLDGDWNVRDTGMFKRVWFPIVDSAPHILRAVRYWDLAATEEDDSNDPDWTVGAKLGMDERTRLLYMVDEQRARLGAQGVEALVIHFIHSYLNDAHERRAREIAPAIPTKSGLMLGLGERPEEIRQTLQDLRAVGGRILTLGQYLQPSQEHLPVEAYVPPDNFENWRTVALEMGFAEVASAPFVRSSYHAKESFNALRR